MTKTGNREKLDYAQLNVMEIILDLPDDLPKRNGVTTFKDTFTGVLTLAIAPLMEGDHRYRVMFAFKGIMDSWHPIAGIQMVTERLRRGDGFYTTLSGLRPMEIECYRTLKEIWEIMQDENISEKGHHLPRWMPDLLDTWNDVLKRKYEIDKIHFPCLGPYRHKEGK